MKDDRIKVMLAINKLIIGGAEQQFLELVKGLDKNRFKPIVVTLYPGGALEQETKNIPGIEFICLNRKSKYDFSVLFTVWRLIRQKHVDIIQPFLTPATFFLLLPTMIRHTPIRVVTERAGVRINASLGYDLYLHAEDFLTRSADWVIPNSESGRRFLIGRGISPKRIKVVYNGINLKRLTPDQTKVMQIKERLGLPENGVVVGISASLTPAKDHATFLKAAQLISHAMPQARFAILGDGPLRPDLENMARELGIGSYVTFLGNQLDVGSYISVFDIACLCSVDLEGCSNVALEAMALGKPVVVTDIGGNKELVKDGQNGLLVPVRNPQVLANTILSCLRQPDWAREMARRGREMVLTRFSIDRMVHDYEALYEEAIKAKRARQPLTI